MAFAPLPDFHFDTPRQIEGRREALLDAVAAGWAGITPETPWRPCKGGGQVGIALRTIPGRTFPVVNCPECLRVVGASRGRGERHTSRTMPWKYARKHGTCRG